jgi:hypothetical protein
MRQKDLKTFITLILIFLISASTVSFTLFRQRDKVSYQMYINNQKIFVCSIRSSVISTNSSRVEGLI